MSSLILFEFYFERSKVSHETLKSSILIENKLLYKNIDNTSINKSNGDAIIKEINKMKTKMNEIDEMIKLYTTDVEKIINKVV
jgi:hypothetical protein